MLDKRKRTEPGVLGLLACVFLIGVSTYGRAAERGLTSSQKRTVTRIWRLQKDINTLLGTLPPEAQMMLRRQLAESFASKEATRNEAALRKLDRGDRPVIPDGGPQARTYVRCGSGEVAVLDMRGNGLDLSGSVIVIASDQPTRVAWTKPNSDDAFLVLDATALRQAGLDLRSAVGEALTGHMLFSGNLRLKDPGGREVFFRTPLHLLGALDSNRDGRVTALDRCWPHLLLLTDHNGNGAIDTRELQRLASSGVTSLVLKPGQLRPDAHGNTLTPWAFSTRDGQTRNAAHVKLKAAPHTTW